MRLGAIIYCGLVPTIILMDATVWGGGPTVAHDAAPSNGSICAAAMPMPFSDCTNVLAASTARSSEPRWTLTRTPVAYSGPSTVQGAGPAFQCALCNIECNECASGVVSGVPEGKIFTSAVIPENSSIFRLISSESEGDNARADSLASSRTLASRSVSAFWFASAARALALAISEFALANSASAFLLCTSSDDVLHSDCCSRMLEVRHCSNRNAMPAQAPIAVITPAASNPFQAIGYQYSAHANRAGSVGDRSETIWFWSTISIIALAPAALLSFAGIFLWRTRR
jgi:hypothetical protein